MHERSLHWQRNSVVTPFPIQTSFCVCLVDLKWVSFPFFLKTMLRSEPLFKYMIILNSTNIYWAFNYVHLQEYSLTSVCILWGMWTNFSPLKFTWFGRVLSTYVAPTDKCLFMESYNLAHSLRNCVVEVTFLPMQPKGCSQQWSIVSTLRTQVT